MSRHLGEVLLELPEEDWVLVKGTSKGHPYFMSVNDSLKQFYGKNEYPSCLIVTVELEDVQGHKLPTDSEAEVLNDIEDTLIDMLSEITLPILVGRETYYGEREILVYFPELSDYKPVVDSISQKLNSSRCVHIELHDDPKWEQAVRYLGRFNDA
jgi:hypothetical protein